MNKSGPFIFIENDLDDQEMLEEVFRELKYPNELIFFEDGEDALKYLNDSKVEPFILFSDINMPKLSGMALRNKVVENEDLKLKSIPYLFFSTSAEQAHIVEAYSKSIQGFFVKPNTFSELKDTIGCIVTYWQKCVSPNYIRDLGGNLMENHTE